MASNRGPNAISSESYNAGSNNIASGVGGSWGGGSSSGHGRPSVASSARIQAFDAAPVNHNPVVHISGHPGAANTSGTFEKNLIMELCPPGGMKPEPPSDKLANFCRSLPDLNSDLVCPALLDMLEDGQPWVIRAKVLCVMEKCVEIGDEMAKTSGNNVYADFFHMCCEEIIPLANHTRVAVREPAKRVLKAMGLEIPADTTSVPQKAVAVAPMVVQQQVVQQVVQQQVVQQVEAPNLLDFDEPSGFPPPIPADAPPVPPPPPAQAPPAPPVASASSSGSLFGGMTVKAAAAAPVPAPVAAFAPPTTFVDDGADVFGVVEDVQPTRAPAPAMAKPASFGLFDDMVVTPATEVSSGKENVEVSLLL